MIHAVVTHSSNNQGCKWNNVHKNATIWTVSWTRYINICNWDLLTILVHFWPLGFTKSQEPRSTLSPNSISLSGWSMEIVTSFFFASFPSIIFGFKIPTTLGVPSRLKLHSECNFCWLLGGGGGKSKKLRLYYVRKRGEGSIKTRQNFDFFSFDGTPYWAASSNVPCELFQRGT